MYTRLAFAVVAHLQPEILIIDEVLAVGDSAFQDRCLRKIDHIARHEKMVLFVSHTWRESKVFVNVVFFYLTALWWRILQHEMLLQPTARTLLK
jgi:lipopolysaccharide transport system ATP-binding protein